MKTSTFIIYALAILVMASFNAFLVATNSFWLCQIIYYLIKEKRGAASFG